MNGISLTPVFLNSSRVRRLQISPTSQTRFQAWKAIQWSCQPSPILETREVFLHLIKSIQLLLQISRREPPISHKEIHATFWTVFTLWMSHHLEGRSKNKRNQKYHRSHLIRTRFSWNIDEFLIILMNQFLFSQINNIIKIQFKFKVKIIRANERWMESYDSVANFDATHQSTYHLSSRNHFFPLGWQTWTSLSRQPTINILSLYLIG